MKLAFQVTAVVLAALLAGCAEEAVEEEGLPGPEPVTQRLLPNERLLSDFYKKSGLNEPLPENPDAIMTKPAADRLTKSVAELQRSADRAENPEGLITTVADEISVKIKEAEERKLWSFVQPLVESYQILRPDDKLFGAYIERAQTQLTRPRVALRGLYHDHNSGMTTASIKVFNPLTRETTTENVRMGEEVNGLKFTKVIGKDEGIELELPATGMVFQIMKGDDLK